MKIDNKEKYQVSGALLNKLLFDARNSTLRQIELADIRLVNSVIDNEIMEFTLRTSGYFYPEKERRTKLEKIGFTFNPSDYLGFTIAGEPTVEIKDLNELIQFANKWDGVIIGEGTIEIYDDYRE